jgi:serine/threonine protein kinase
LEYCEGGTLQELIHEHGALSEKEARRYLQQIKIGMEFLRNHKISHQVSGARCNRDCVDGLQ